MTFLTRLFQPVRVHLLFARRVYRLGDKIEMAVQVVTRDRLEVGRAKAELLWTPKGPGAKAIRAEFGDGPFVHSSVTFSNRRILRPGSEESFSVDLVTATEPPAGGAVDPRWKARVTLECLNRRNYWVENPIKIFPHWTGEPDPRE